MKTYNVNVTQLEGILLWFQVHKQASFPRFHQTLNDAYGLDLYNSNFEFIFDDVKTNELTEILKDALTMLRSYLTDHIKQELGSTTRDTAKKVDTLFDNMELSYDKSWRHCLLHLQSRVS